MTAIAKVAAVKPVVTVMGGTAASAGYMIAVPAARIFAREATLTGSIGVILETGDVSGLLASIGISADPIVSGPLKDQPSFVKPLSPQGRDVLQGLVMDMYDQFVEHGRERAAHGCRRTCASSPMGAPIPADRRSSWASSTRSVDESDARAWLVGGETCSRGSAGLAMSRPAGLPSAPWARV